MPGASGYSRSAVDTVIGLLLLLVFVACVVGLAAGITWLVVRADAAVRRLRGKTVTANEA
jgi:hypothetical protein